MAPDVVNPAYLGCIDSRSIVRVYKQSRTRSIRGNQNGTYLTKAKEQDG